MGRSIAEHANRMRVAIESGEAARSLVVASWRRCAEVYRLDPASSQPREAVSASELRDAIERASDFLVSCDGAVDRLRHTFAGSRACILITGADGVPVIWSGQDADAESLRAWGLWPGFDWCEERGGTNGIGTCLVERRPVSIHGEDHFYPQSFDIGCSAAPLFDHEGNLAGALNVTLYGRTAGSVLPGLALAAVVDAARQMEADHFHRVFARCRILSFPGSRSGSALLAVDEDDVVVGATRVARAMFDFGDDELRRGVCASDLVEGAADGLARAERAVIRRTLVRLNGNVSASASALDVSRATLKRKIRQHGLGRRR